MTCSAIYVTPGSMLILTQEEDISPEEICQECQPGEIGGFQDLDLCKRGRMVVFVDSISQFSNVYFCCPHLV